MMFRDAGKVRVGVMSYRWWGIWFGERVNHPGTSTSTNAGGPALGYPQWRAHQVAVFLWRVPIVWTGSPSLLWALSCFPRFHSPLYSFAFLALLVYFTDTFVLSLSSFFLSLSLFLSFFLSFFPFERGHRSTHGTELSQYTLARQHNENNW